MQVYGRIIYDTSSSPRDPRDRSWCSRSFTFTFSLFLSNTRIHAVALVPMRAIVSRPDENNRCRKSRTAPLSLRDPPQPLLWRLPPEFRTKMSVANETCHYVNPRHLLLPMRESADVITGQSVQRPRRRVSRSFARAIGSLKLSMSELRERNATLSRSPQKMNGEYQRNVQNEYQAIHSILAREMRLLKSCTIDTSIGNKIKSIKEIF